MIHHFSTESKCSITNYNASTNYGKVGGSSFSLRKVPATLVKYVNVINSMDRYALENWDLQNEFTYMNIINSLNCSGGIIYLTEDNVMTLKNCVFIDNFKTFKNPKTKYTAINCFSSSVIGTMSIESNPKTNFISIEFLFDKKPLTCKIKRNSRVLFLNFIFFPIIL